MLGIIVNGEGDIMRLLVSKITRIATGREITIDDFLNHIDSLDESYRLTLYKDVENVQHYIDVSHHNDILLYESSINGFIVSRYGLIINEKLTHEVCAKLFALVNRLINCGRLPPSCNYITDLD